MATKIITVHFTSNGYPQSGLTPTIDIYELGNSPSVNTEIVVQGATTEIGGGWYRYDFVGYDSTKSYVFTFDGGATLSITDRYRVGGNESHAEDIAPAVWEEQTTSHLSSGTTGLMLTQIKADTASVLISEAAMTVLLSTIVKYERNRTKIDVSAAQLVIYDDDGTTPLTTFDLRDFNGMPSVQEVCERIPV